MSKKVAVIILNWNGVNFLSQFLKSVVDNTSSTLADIIVADNGSTDASIEYIQANFPSVQVIEFDKNYGFTGGYNRAIAAIEHEYCVLLNSDVEVTSGWLDLLTTEMDANLNVGACMPKIISYYDKNLFEYAGASGGFLDILGYPFCRGRILSTLEEDSNQYNIPAKIFWATGACLMVRTGLYKQLDGLDSDFFAHMEEIDFCWRLQHLGYTVMVYPQSKIFHVGGGTLPNNNPKKMYLNFRNSLLMLTKNLPQRSLYPTLFARMILDGVAGVCFLAKGQASFFVAVLKAHRDFYKMFRTFSKKRDAVGKCKPNGLYKKSIVISYMLGAKTFDKLNTKYFTK